MQEELEGGVFEGGGEGFEGEVYLNVLVVVGY